MISGGIEVNGFAKIRLTVQGKLRTNSLEPTSIALASMKTIISVRIGAAKLY